MDPSTQQSQSNAVNKTDDPQSALPPVDLSMQKDNTPPLAAVNDVASASKTPDLDALNSTAGTTQDLSQKQSQYSPQVADDVDLIEKEWVQKAKKIIEKTANNPAEQSDEINKYKADYLKIRYSKDLKVSEK